MILALLEDVFMPKSRVDVTVGRVTVKIRLSTGRPDRGLSRGIHPLKRVSLVATMMAV